MANVKNVTQGKRDGKDFYFIFDENGKEISCCTCSCTKFLGCDGMLAHFIATADLTWTRANGEKKSIKKGDKFAVNCFDEAINE